MGVDDGDSAEETVGVKLPYNTHLHMWKDEYKEASNNRRYIEEGNKK